MQLEGGGRGGYVVAIAAFIPFRGSTWRVMGVSPSFAAKSYRGRILSTARSFRPLSEEERRSIHGMQLRLVNARAGEDLVVLGQRSGNAWDPTSTAVYNGLLSDHRFQGGELVKIARVEAYTSPEPTPPTD